MQWLDLPLTPSGRWGVYRFSFFIGGCVFFVLAVFQPFGTAEFRHAVKYLILAGYWISIAAGCIAGWELLQLTRWRPEAWRLRHEALMVVYIFLTGASAAWIYQQIIFGLTPSVGGFIGFMFIALSTSILPIGFYVALKYVKARNEHEKTTWIQQQPTDTSNQTLVLRGDNRHETITVLKSELLYLQSADNYVQIYLYKGAQIQRVMLRGAITRILEQIDDPCFVQTHRSYVVNLRQPVRLEGKSPNYTLTFALTTAESIESVPVSKSSVAMVREVLSKLPV
jgi:hypothetical protein